MLTVDPVGHGQRSCPHRRRNSTTKPMPRMLTMSIAPSSRNSLLRKAGSTVYARNSLGFSCPSARRLRPAAEIGRYPDTSERRWGQTMERIFATLLLLTSMLLPAQAQTIQSNYPDRRVFVVNSCPYVEISDFSFQSRFNDRRTTFRMPGSSRRGSVGAVTAFTAFTASDGTIAQSVVAAFGGPVRPRARATSLVDNIGDRPWERR